MPDYTIVCPAPPADCGDCMEDSCDCHDPTSPDCEVRILWLAERAKLITASDVAKVMGLTKWGTALDVYMDKHGLAAPFAGNAKTEAGLFLEETIIRFYTHRTGNPASRAGELLRSNLTPCMGATLDAWTIVDGVQVPLQVKNTAYGDDWEDGVPEMYRVQVLDEVYVSGAPFGVLAGLIGGWDLRWMIIERDDEFMERMVSECVDFWQHVTDETPPHSTNPSALAQLYNEDNGTVVVLDQDAVEIDDSLVLVKSEIRNRTATRDRLNAELMTMIGNAHKGVLPGGAGAYIFATSKAGKRYLRRVKK